MNAKFVSTGSSSKEKIYLFIDGGYLRRRYEDSLRQFFGPLENPLQYLDLQVLRHHFGAEKVFYYDCSDDRPETEKFFSRIRCEQGYHIRTGTLVEGKQGYRQKGVDVYLAVEALKHAFYGNMDRARIISGDLDFKPLVDVLIDIGTYVIVYYGKGHAAQELLEAADDAQEIRLTQWYNWSAKEFRERHPLPRFAHPISNHPGPGLEVLCEGLFNGLPGAIYTSTVGKKVYVIFVPGYDKTNEPPRALRIEGDDLEKLKRFFELEFGPLQVGPCA